MLDMGCHGAPSIYPSARLLTIDPARFHGIQIPFGPTWDSIGSFSPEAMGSHGASWEAMRIPWDDDNRGRPWGPMETHGKIHGSGRNFSIDSMGSH